MTSMRIAPTSSRLDSDELFSRWREQGDGEARDELVRRYLPLARKLASRYARTQEPFDDLFQVASLALVKAVDRFDPDRGLAFSSFAVPTILGELKRHFRDKGWAIHMPRGLLELMLSVQNAEATLSSRGGRSPTVVEIAEYLNIDTEQVLEGLEAVAARRPSSLDQPIVSEARDESTLVHESIGSDDEGYAQVDMSVTLAAAFEQLRPSDRRVLALRINDELTQKQIAERIGVSQMQVSRILRRIADELHGRIELEPRLSPHPTDSHLGEVTGSR